MPGRVEGKVAFITGAARGQGRSHAVRLAEEGADIIAVDICAPVPGAVATATPEDLAQTVRQVEALDRRIVAAQADVRDYAALKRALDDGVAELGRLDIVAANAGIANVGSVDEIDEQSWQDQIDINLTGVWHTMKVAIPHLRAAGGGSMILTSSVAGLAAYANIAHYAAAKHGVVGLMRALALELAPDRIRVNSIHPGNTSTPMFHNDTNFALFMPELSESERTEEIFAERASAMQALPVPWLEPIDMSNALLFLASDEARYITGVTLPVDAGTMLK